MEARWDHVLDASAVVAYLFGEPGAEQVEPLLGGRGAISAVNLAEVLKIVRFEASDPAAGLLDALAALGLAIPPFEAGQAETAADLYGMTRGLKLGLGDRACLALALRSGRPAVTADQEWRRIPSRLGIQIEFIRDARPGGLASATKNGRP